MKRILIAILTALTLLAGWTPAADAADRTPLLMEGKKTLYQRVIKLNVFKVNTIPSM